MNNFLQKTSLLTYYTLMLFILSASQVLAQPPAPKTFKITIANPTPYTTIEDVILAVLAAVRVIAIPIIIFFIIYGGFLYVTARGNAQQIEQATRQLTYAILGAILVLGAIVLAEIIKQLINDFRP